MYVQCSMEITFKGLSCGDEFSCVFKVHTCQTAASLQTEKVKVSNGCENCLWNFEQNSVLPSTAKTSTTDKTENIYILLKKFELVKNVYLMNLKKFETFNWTWILAWQEKWGNSENFELHWLYRHIWSRWLASPPNAAIHRVHSKNKNWPAIQDELGKQ